MNAQLHGLDWKKQISDLASDISSDAAKAAFESPGGRKAISAVTAAAVTAASETAKKEVATLVLPAFIAGLALAYFLKK